MKLHFHAAVLIGVQFFFARTDHAAALDFSSRVV